MWDERKMPERWYELLRERMRVEEQRIRVIQDGEIIENDDLEHGPIASTAKCCW